MNLIVVDTPNEYAVPWLFKKMNRMNGIQFLLKRLTHNGFNAAILCRSACQSQALAQLGEQFDIPVVHGFFYAEAWQNMLSTTPFTYALWLDARYIFTDTGLINNILEFHRDNAYHYTVGVPGGTIPDVVSGAALAQTCSLPKVFPKNYPERFNIGKYKNPEYAEHGKLACWTDYFNLKAGGEI